MDENLNNNGNVQIPVPEKNDYPTQEQQTGAAPQTPPVVNNSQQVIPGYQQQPNQPYQPPVNQGYQQQPNVAYQQPVNQGYQQQPNVAYQQPVNQGYQQQPNVAYQQPVNQGYQQQPNVTYQQVGTAPVNAVAAKANKKYLPIIIGAAAVAFIAFICIVIFAITSLGKTTVDMSKYYEISVKGFNGYAKASISETVDPYTALSAEGKIKTETSLNSALSAYAFFSDIDGKLSKTQNISNGDTIELTFTYNKDLAKRLKFKVKNTTIKLKVSGLEDGKKIDPFADLELTFTGVSPNGKVTVNNNNGDDFIRRISYSVDKKSKLKNGDTIIVTASYNEDYAIENGYVVTATTKEYQVSGLSYYLDDKTTISAENKTAFEKEFKDRIDSILASRAESIYNQFGDSVYGGETPTVGTPQLVKGYILCVKNTDNYYSTYNKLVIVYKVDINVQAGKYSSSPEKFGKRTGYVAVEFTNAGISSEGILLNSSTSTYSGYKASDSMDELENDLVTVNKSNYIVTHW